MALNPSDRCRSNCENQLGHERLTMNKQIQQTITPIDGSIYAERELASGNQIEEILARAVSAQQDWKRASVAERVAVCKRMLEWILDRADQIGEELTWQIGRPFATARLKSAEAFSERVSYMAEIAERELPTSRLNPKRVFSASFAANRSAWFWFSRRGITRG